MDGAGDDRDERTGRRALSRRAFIAIGALAPLVAVACRRKPPPPAETGAPPPSAPGADGAEPADAPPPQRPLPPASEPVVRVRVLSVSAADRRVLRIGAAGEWIELCDLGSGANGSAGSDAGRPVVLHGPVEIDVRRGAWSILDGRRFRPSIGAESTIEVRSLRGGAQAMVAVDGEGFAGFLRLVPRAGGPGVGFDVVNHVALEHYLPAVLERELFAHWHPQAFAAQAIVARAFACCERSYRQHRRYDLTNTTLSQMYGGGVAHDRAQEAVAATRGVVVAFEGRVLPGYYSSCCGGRAATARDAIGAHPFNDALPLAGRHETDLCEGATLHRWTITRPLDDVIARMRLFGATAGRAALAEIASLASIDVADVNEHGRPRRYAVVPRDGAPILVTSEELRRAVDCKAGAEGGPGRPLWSSDLAVAIEGDRVRFEGRGHGHGVGLCQHGAEAQARAGRGYPEIVESYYPGATLTRAYP